MASSESEVEFYTTVEALEALHVSYKGLVVVNKVQTRNLFKDIGTGLKSIVGGEVKNLTKMTAEMRQELMKQAADEAVSRGANAILGIRFETNSVFEGTMDMVMYGTAVKVERNKMYPSHD